MAVIASRGTFNSTQTYPSGNRVPFGTATTGGAWSPWNKTLAQLYGGTGNTYVPCKAPATNDTYINNVPLQNGAGAWIPYLSCDTTQYCIPFYIVTSAMVFDSAKTKLAYSGVHCEARDDLGTTTNQNSGAGSPYTFPFKVPATLKTPLGSDSQFMFWDRDNILGTGGEWWDLWSVVVDGSNQWLPDGSGFMQCTNFSHGTGEILYSGKPPTSPNQYASRGPGTPYMLGTNTYWEYLQGNFNHVGAMAFTFPAATVFDSLVACKTDGAGVDGTQPREGSLIFLKSTFPVTDLPGGTSGILQMTARQWQTYGMRIVDSSGTPKCYFEGDVSVGLGANWGGLLPVNLLEYIPADEFCYVDDTGVSSTRETDLRIDASKSDDPIGTLPVCIATYLATDAAAPVATVAALTNDELVVAHVSIRGNNALAVSSVVGTNGLSGTWKRFCRWSEDQLVNGSNLQSELWFVRATSGTAGTVTATTNGSNNANLNVARFTVGTAVRKKFSAQGTGTSAPSQLRSTTTNSLTVQWVTTRNATLAAEGGQTGVNLNQTSGSGGTVMNSSLLTKPGGGDILQTPTFGSIEWLATAYEVT